jgi:hypothetical protein
MRVLSIGSALIGERRIYNEKHDEIIPKKMNEIE